TASLAAATASWENRPRCLTRAGSMNVCGRKFETSAAIPHGYFDASTSEIGPIPDFPARRLAQKTSLPMPLGATTPRPVTTTRRRSVIEVARRSSDRADLTLLPHSALQ